MSAGHQGAAQAPADAVTALLWRRSAPARPGPKPRFSVEQIADTAIAIADEHGLDAVTMQSVAARLGTTKMALYRYVPGRVELEAVMLDRALGEPPSTAVGRDWRAALGAWAGGVHERAAAHPWSVELAQRPHVPGPRELLWYERGISAVVDLPLRGGEKLDTLVLLAGHVMSVVRQSSGGPTPEEDLARGLAPILAERADDYPLTAAAFARTEATAPDDALRFGIERVVAGVGALVDARS